MATPDIAATGIYEEPEHIYDEIADIAPVSENIYVSQYSVPADTPPIEDTQSHSQTQLPSDEIVELAPPPTFPTEDSMLAHEPEAATRAVEFTAQADFHLPQAEEQLEDDYMVVTGINDAKHQFDDVDAELVEPPAEKSEPREDIMLPDAAPVEDAQSVEHIE